MTNAEHFDLIDRIQSLKGKVLLSGYANPIYDQLPWNHFSHTTVCHAIGKTRNSGLQAQGEIKRRQQRVECLWLNYEPLQPLLF